MTKLTNENIIEIMHLTTVKCFEAGFDKEQVIATTKKVAEALSMPDDVASGATDDVVNAVEQDIEVEKIDMTDGLNDLSDLDMQL